MDDLGATLRFPFSVNLEPVELLFHYTMPVGKLNLVDPVCYSWKIRFFLVLCVCCGD